jgi:exodeoxyribonuclease III
MRIYSYNVNGLRAAMSKGFTDWLRAEDPDVVCLQEIKASADQIDVSAFENLDYSHYWRSAEKKGYSGVGILSKRKPDKIVYGMNNARYDAEGRVIRADFGDFTLVCAYFPSGTTGGVRQDFKMEFLEAFLSFALALRKERPLLQICGDFNICHKGIDINFPEKHTKMSGFLPEERAWMDRLTEQGFIDTFRVFNSEPGHYSWWSYRANSRNKNLGWRIDYHMVSSALKEKLKAAGIQPEVIYSDHCPVWAEVDVDG